MDLTFRTPEGNLNVRACAVIVDGGRILAMHDDRSPYYYLPGGRVQLHEAAESAVLREVREELECGARIVRPLWVHQSFFVEDVDGERYHEICFYFLVRLDDGRVAAHTGPFTLWEEGKKRHVFEWLPMETVKDRYFYPLFLKERLPALPATTELLTTVE